ncbi:serine hydrolase domain-containing protein [Flexivirga caeni]|uniref:Class A beta-lactamase-related serine hydrolase n=1 Tax=Flexivirga caeni TaxID=2294115 RepID=A0A3M9M692_9MICO|nr:serine hydrolase domain-containing protein [Flexivirga caeni]RNI21071.1 class A beta-lactamase-related serine hydrolase [Flexivirga caeni]
MSNETIRIPIESQLDAFFAQYVAADTARGLVYGLSGPDGLRHSTGFGVVSDDGLVPDADTIFPIASMSKSFIACAALIARDRGLLSLDDPITTYFPQFSASGTADDPCDPPTLGMLLSMSGGLTEDNSWVDPFIDASEDEVLEQVGKGLRYSHVPGLVYEYSNLGYALAGLAVGRAAGSPIERFVHDEIFLPLGLTATCFDNAAPAGVSRATGYHLDTEGNWVGYPHVASAAFAAAGGIMSTVRDLTTWISWLGAAFRAPQCQEPQILSRASRRELQRLRILDCPSVTVGTDGALHPAVTGYGLGVRIDLDLQRGTIVGHGGGLPGFSLFMCWHPDSGHGVVTLTNSHRSSAGIICLAALRQLLAYDATPSETIVLWPETVQLRESVDRLIRQWDDDLAGQVFAPNVDFDRSLRERRAEIDELIERIGPLGDPRPSDDIVSAATAADVTWSIPGAHGELLCLIHLTPVEPAQVQEIVIQAVPAGRPRYAAPVDLSPRRGNPGDPVVSAARNVRVELP